METSQAASTTDKSFRQVQWLVAVGSGVILLLSVLLPLSLVETIHICAFRNLTGYPCPFCGMTRAFLALAHGNLASAWHITPLGVPLFILTVLALGWSVAGLLLRRRLTTPLPWRWIWPAGIVVLLVNWLYRLAMGLK